MIRKIINRLVKFLNLQILSFLILLFGYRLHNKYFAIAQNFKAFLFPEPNITPSASEISVTEKASKSDPTIPYWVLAEMKDLGRAIDPAIYPTEAFIASCQYYTYPVIPKPGHVYAELIRQCSTEHYAFCFALPWLKRGGSDYVSLKHIEFAHRHTSGKVLVILTELGDSPWLEFIPEGVDILDFSKIDTELSHEEIIVILSRLLVQLQIDTLHIINCRHIWDVIKKHGLAVRQKTKVFVSIYGDDYVDGCPVGYARQYLGSCYQHITKVFSDNNYFPLLLQNTYGYSPDFFTVLKSPAQNLPSDTRNPIGKRVLWAGRLDREKRPDLLLAIALLMPDTEFYVYGDELFGTSSHAVAELKQLQNVVMKGTYEGVGAEKVPFNDFSVFLYTSQWDGTPTIIIAAAFASIPVVASCVGGVGDIVNEKTGFPIHDIENVSLYVNAIRYVLDNPEEAENMASVAKKYIENEHSQTTFELNLLNTEGYLSDTSSYGKTS
jgi:glycosyltransferase involved in cell wall biosynthesis